MSVKGGASARTPTLAELAKRGRCDELFARVDDGEEADLAQLFERAVTDFRTVKRRPGHAAVLLECVRRGLDLLARPDWTGQTVVSLAAQYGQAEAIGAMAERGLPDEPFSRASVGDLGFFDSLAGDVASLRDVNGFNLLFPVAASSLGKGDAATGARLRELCALFLERGVDPAHEVASNLPLTAPFLCCWFGGDAGILEQLLERTELGVEEALQCIEFCLEPHQRSGEPHGELAAMVLAAGQDVNAIRPSQGRTLLHGSSNRGSIEAVRWLLEHGADPHARDGGGGTPLHAAAVRNTSPGVVELLLAAGADRGATDGEGRTPRDLALAKGRTGLLEFL